MRSASERLERFLDELDTWNQRLNLTTVPRETAWQRHIEETIGLLAVAEVAAGAECVDIGSGGGIPGVVVAVLRPDLRMALVESDQRKCGFLIHVSGLLELDNVSVLARRAEDLGGDPRHRHRYDVAFSRAAAPPSKLCRLALPLLRPGGRLWALVRDAEAAAATVRPAVDEGVVVGTAGSGVLTVLKPAD